MTLYVPAQIRCKTAAEADRIFAEIPAGYAVRTGTQITITKRPEVTFRAPQPNVVPLPLR